MQTQCCFPQTPLSMFLRHYYKKVLGLEGKQKGLMGQCMETYFYLFIFFFSIRCEVWIKKRSLMPNNDSEKLIPAGIWCENDVVLTLMRRDYVASTLIRRHFDTKCPLGCFYPNLKPIIDTFSCIHFDFQCLIW